MTNAFIISRSELVIEAWHLPPQWWECCICLREEMRAFTGCGGVLWRVIFGDVFVRGGRVGVGWFGLVWF